MGFYGRNIREPELRIEGHPCYSIPRKVGKIFSEGNPIVMVSRQCHRHRHRRRLRSRTCEALESEIWNLKRGKRITVTPVWLRSRHVEKKHSRLVVVVAVASASVVVNRVESTTIDVANGNIELTLESPSTFGSPIKKMIYQERSFILDDDEEAVWRRGEQRALSNFSSTMRSIDRH
ncbi:hypothetical protein V1478_011886 [Vespula squamosa]|uniref:Uncharacterized protein n=1 Tax=Vespula squamosa TaxID=30214 RepID=A0ABD2AE89_VESSQ